MSILYFFEVVCCSVVALNYYTDGENHWLVGFFIGLVFLNAAGLFSHIHIVISDEKKEGIRHVN